MYIEEQIKDLNKRLTKVEAGVAQNEFLIDDLTVSVRTLIKLNAELTEDLSKIISTLNSSSPSIPNV